MADFCFECTFNILPELLPTGENDLAGLCEPGLVTWAVWEGCGAGWFDTWGRRGAYAADTLRLADRIVDYDSTQGFLVMLNKEKQQHGLVSLADARVVYPHLPAAAKARMKALSVGQAHQ